VAKSKRFCRRTGHAHQGWSFPDWDNLVCPRGNGGDRLGTSRIPRLRGSGQIILAASDGARRGKLAVGRLRPTGISLSGKRMATTYA